MSRNKLIPYRADLKDKARRLRRSGTLGERLLWLQISRCMLGSEFHRQVPILDYIVDFYCHELHLAVELDGKSHQNPDQGRADIRRESRLRAVGVIIIHFSEEETCRDASRVAQAIAVTVEELREVKRQK